MPTSPDTLLDRLVAEYADRIQDDPQAGYTDLLEQVPSEHREPFERCLRMIGQGIVRAPRASAALGPGVVLDGYRILRELGRGGMAVVYLAEQLDLERQVALKVLRPGLAVEERHVDRFRREGLAIARLKHPHIVQVYAVGESDGHHYLAMEYVKGTTLAHVFTSLPEGKRWTAEDLARAAGIPALAAGHAGYEQAFSALLAPVARAIGLAHELGLVHRDVKPSNILIHEDGRAVIADFGLAKGDHDAGLSLTGEPLGTPSYMSPEQAALTTHAIDRRTDVYSLGVTLYEGLAGERPFDGDTFMAVLEAIRTRVPASLRSIARDRSRDAEAVVRRAMERDPSDRYANCLDLATELSALAEGRPTQAGAREGGLVRRMRRFFRVGAGGESLSRRKFLGMPLYHVFTGPRMPGQKLRHAHAWFAVGDVATGGFAAGPLAFGLFAWGGMAGGLFSFSGIGLGVFPLAGVALGLFPNGGIAIGYVACGAVSLGVYAAGALPHGMFTVGPGSTDPEAVTMVGRWMPWWQWIMSGAR